MPRHMLWLRSAAEEMLGYLARGADNRHTGETRLNRESSRSHSVFTCTVEKTVTSNGVSKIYFARIHLIDLAGAPCMLSVVKHAHVRVECPSGQRHVCLPAPAGHGQGGGPCSKGTAPGHRGLPSPQGRDAYSCTPLPLPC